MTDKNSSSFIQDIVTEVQEGSEDNFVTVYTLVHFASGIVAERLGISLFGWIAIHTLFEIWENSTPGIRFFREKDSILHKISGLNWRSYGGDTLANSLFDSFAAILGWLISNRLKFN